MTVEILKQLLGWCTLINIGFLVFWVGFLVAAPNFIYQLQSKWVEIPREKFNAIHFLLIGIYKLLILFFNLIPYITLHVLM